MNFFMSRSGMTMTIEYSGAASIITMAGAIALPMRTIMSTRMSTSAVMKPPIPPTTSFDESAPTPSAASGRAPPPPPRPAA